MDNYSKLKSRKIFNIVTAAGSQKRDFFSSQRQSMLVTSKHRGSFDNMHTCTCIQTWPSRRKQSNYPNSQILHIKLSKINFATGTKDSEF